MVDVIIIIIIVAVVIIIIDQVCGEIYPKDKKIIWFNMR